MKKILLSAIFCTSLILVNRAIAQQYQYTFNNTFNEFSGGPALTETVSCSAVTGSFIPNQVITTTSGTCLSGAGTTVFSFNEGGGLSFSNNPSFITNTYTIHAFFKFNPFTGGYGRIFDFSNSTADAGIYVLGNCLNFYPFGNVGTCPYFVDGNYYLITIVRNGLTNQIKVYVNGTVFTTYDDASARYQPTTATTPIIFFRDDNPVPCEDRPGNVKYISLSPTISTDADVATVFSNICTAIALPVTLISFDVTKTSSSNILLNWKSSQEIGITAYDIERSSDGINFRTIGTVNARGNNAAIQAYDFTDAAPATGINYYRIRINDRNNSIKYSVIKNVKNNATTSLSIYPTPITDVLKVRIEAGSAGKGILTILDASGKQLHYQMIAVSFGANDVSINSATLSKGIYLLKVVLNDQNYMQKFIKR